MSLAIDKQHGPSGGFHSCIFCRCTYECFVDHMAAGEPVAAGARCCTSCRLTNLALAKKLRCV